MILTRDQFKRGGLPFRFKRVALRDCRICALQHRQKLRGHRVELDAVRGASRSGSVGRSGCRSHRNDDSADAGVRRFHGYALRQWRTRANPLRSLLSQPLGDRSWRINARMDRCCLSGRCAAVNEIPHGRAHLALKPSACFVQLRAQLMAMNAPPNASRPRSARPFRWLSGTHAAASRMARREPMAGSRKNLVDLPRFAAPSAKR